MAREKTLYLIDGNAQFHRAYFAIRGLTTSRGLPTNATYGFTTMLRKLLEEEDPQFIGVTFDLPGPTFRHEAYPEYKAHRPRMDDDLAVQIPYVRRVCEVFRLPIFEAAGFEADDVIATLARQAVERGWDVVAVSADKDLLQLVNENVRVLSPGREGTGATMYDSARVEEKFGVAPERVVDVLGLVGDAVDNVPGVPGIGEKGARDLVKLYGSLEGALEHASEVKRKAYREGLQQHRESAVLSKELVTLSRDAPVQLDLDATKRREPIREAARALFLELEFQALARAVAPPTPARSVACRVVDDESALRALVDDVRAAGRTAVALLGTAREPMRAEVLGLGLAWREGEACYIPVGHTGLSEGERHLAPERVWTLLGPLLEDPGVVKLCFGSKHQRVVLAQRGVVPGGVAFDGLLAAYLLDPGRRTYAVEDLVRDYLGEEHPATESVIKPDEASLEGCAQAAGAEAEVLLRLSAPVSARLEKEGLAPVFETLERPLVAVLADIEQAGVKIDAALLGRMSTEMEAQLDVLTRDIHELAGSPFNINSPVQLREILFDRLGLKPGKKTAKTRAASTAEGVLEELAAQHELPGRILQYRSVQKLKSTYVDALPQLIHPNSGRIHALLHQTVAATGRISSSDPNLQNIPIRTPEGRRIREAFVAEAGHLLLSADYSQIELRVLAHLSQDETLIETFQRGEDVHERTAREVFGAFSTLSTDEQRRVAKMVNYALLYGKTAFTLAKDLHVSQRQAEGFIAAYFDRYPRVRDYIKQTQEQARESGQVRTLLGRLRRLPELRAKSYAVRMEAERQAVNTPVQGTAADLIKKAMIELHEELARRGLRSRMILQIHDELLLEVPEGEGEQARELVRNVMEGALTLDVPLVVDARLGRNWAEVH